MPSITHLNQLEADGLISLSQVIPEPAYWFRHALVQETAYQSLVRQDRRELHLAAGEVLEALFQDKLEEQAPGVCLPMLAELRDGARYIPDVGKPRLINHPHFPEAIGVLPYYQFYQACAMYMLGEHKRAQELLSLAEETALIFELNWILWQVFAFQAGIFSIKGDATKAREFQIHAKNIISKVVASTGNSSPGNQFISQPAVQAIISNAQWDEHNTGGE